MRKWFCLWAVAAVALATPGCDWLAAWWAPEPVVLSGADSGRTVALATGQALVVRLEANPSTGYGWEVEALDEAVLALRGTAFEPGGDQPGAGGVSVFRFAARGSGHTTLRLVYHRVWEDVPPLETFAVEVDVR